MKLSHIQSAIAKYRHHLDAVACGSGWEGAKGQCKRAAPKKKSATGRMGAIDRKDPGAWQKTKRREKLIDAVSQRLEREWFSGQDKADRTSAGKMGALTALRDAKDPKVSLAAVTDKNGEYAGFASYKVNRRDIEIENIGTNQAEKGLGSKLFDSILEEAATSGKGLSAASTQDAKGFYKKMGMKSDNETSFYMSAQDVKNAWNARRTGR